MASFAEPLQLQEVQSGKEKLFVHPKFVTLMTQDNNQFSPYFTNRN
ncbi:MULTISPECIES: hypothetical protein [unclassified Shewanella]